MRQPLVAVLLCSLLVHTLVSSIYSYRHGLYGQIADSARRLARLSYGARPPADPQTKPPPPRPAEVRTLVLVAVTESPLSLRGSVAAGARLRLGFGLPGVVRAVRVREGDKVRRGQLLATLQAAGPQAQVLSAAVALDKTRRDNALAEHLETTGAGTALSRQDARTKLQSAEASLAVANETLQRTRLIAPVSGIVYQRLVEPGEAINVGTPILLIDETQRPVVKVGVTDRDLGRLRTGQRAHVSIETLPPSEVLASISSIAPSPDPSDGQYLVQLTPDPQQREPLRPGTLATVHFEDAPAATLQVPLDALVHRRERDWVAVVEGSAGHEVAHLRAITTGRIAGKAATVIAGLQPGERIITEGAAFLQDGQSVQPSD